MNLKSRSFEIMLVYFVCHELLDCLCLFCHDKQACTMSLWDSGVSVDVS